MPSSTAESSLGTAIIEKDVDQNHETPLDETVGISEALKILQRRVGPGLNSIEVQALRTVERNLDSLHVNGHHSSPESTSNRICAVSPRDAQPADHGGLPNQTRGIGTHSTEHNGSAWASYILLLRLDTPSMQTLQYEPASNIWTQHLPPLRSEKASKSILTCQYRPPRYQQPCRYFPNCRYGNSCYYLHDIRRVAPLLSFAKIPEVSDTSGSINKTYNGLHNEISRAPSSGLAQVSEVEVESHGVAAVPDEGIAAAPLSSNSIQHLKLRAELVDNTVEEQITTDTRPVDETEPKVMRHLPCCPDPLDFELAPELSNPIQNVL
ncbi:MAG: hypothetical protein M1820_003045 [Bogoriella megaspora]|nr:MAG: hypothetical protein M1820_003045 [Bogoriella megaspora]